MPQLKVSMVMPCYNKANHISEMFDSVIAQEWDNIELILVNDGSTDGTREVITAYEPKFLERGFEVRILDQENAGVCAAAKAGLERVTGDLVCMVDSDDALDSKYVGVMAGWLAEHDEYDFAACEAQHYIGRRTRKQFHQFEPKEIVDGDPYLAERWLLADFHTEPWRYMLRIEYFRKCRIIETYHTRTKGSHEPGYIIPILAYGGKLKYFPLPLYLFNVDDGSHSRSGHIWQIEKYYAEYLRLCIGAIEALPDAVADSERRRRMINAIAVSSRFRIYREAVRCMYYAPDYNATAKEIIGRISQNNVDRIFAEFVNSVNDAFSIDPPFSVEKTRPLDCTFFEMVKNCLVAPKYRIVGLGALSGQNAKFLRRLQGTPLEPTELWDENGDGVVIKKPEYSSLIPYDTVIMGSCKIDSDAWKIAKNRLEAAGCILVGKRDVLYFESLFSQFTKLIAIGRPEAVIAESLYVQ